jgi:hypothetical protein
MKAPARFPVMPLLIAGLFCATEARADGGFVAAMDPIEEPTQTALILHLDGVQEMTLEVSYQGPARDFGWLVPLPAVPEIDAGADDLFDRLAASTRILPFGPIRAMARGHIRLGIERVGPALPASILATRVYTASEVTDLFQWMDDHRLARTPAVAAAVADYFSRGWVFAAMNIGADDDTGAEEPAVVRGSIRPVRFRFPSAEPVFPLRISAVNPGPSDILLYVMSDRFLAPRTSGHLAWYTRLGDARRSLDEATGFSPGERINLRTTRLFAKVRPEEMTQDVYFSRYDPAHRLGSPDVEERIEAMTMSGVDGRRDLGSAILARVSALTAGTAEPGIDRELHVGLWTLGRLRSEEAASILLHHARSGAGPTRDEAILALTRLNAPEVEPFLIEQLVGGRHLLSKDQAPQQPIPAAARRLARRLDPANVGRLREAVAQSGAHAEWRALVGKRGHPIETGALQLLALSARHGDLLARQTIIDALVASGPENPWVENGWRRRSSRGGMSNADWTVLMEDEDAPSPHVPSPSTDWALLRFTAGSFAGAPDVTLELLTEVAADHRLAPAARDRVVRHIGTIEEAARLAWIMAGRSGVPPPSLAMARGGGQDARAGATGSS